MVYKDGMTNVSVDVWLKTNNPGCKHTWVV